MNRESEAARKRSLIKTNFPISEGASLFTLSGKTSPSLLEKLKPIFELAKDFYFQGTFLLECRKGWAMTKAGEWEDEGA